MEKGETPGEKTKEKGQGAPKRTKNEICPSFVVSRATKLRLGRTEKRARLRDQTKLPYSWRNRETLAPRGGTRSKEPRQPSSNQFSTKEWRIGRKTCKKGNVQGKFYKSFLPPQLEQKLKSELIRRGQLTRQRKQTESDKTHRRESKTSQKKRERPVPRTYASIKLQRANIPLTRNFRTQKNKKIAERRLTW